MKIKHLLFTAVICSLFISVNSFAYEDLYIGSGSDNILIDLNGKNGVYADIYSDTTTYNDISIFAETKVILNSEWQDVLVSSKTHTGEVEGESGKQTRTDIVELMYARTENLATLSFADENAKLTLNDGSHLSIRNEYNLIVSTGANVTLQYEKYKKDGKDYIAVISSAATTTLDEKYLNTYEHIDEYGRRTEYTTLDLTKNSGSVQFDSPNLFTGDIIFAAGNSEDGTVLTFRDSPSESKVSDEFVGPDSPSQRTQTYKDGSVDVTVKDDVKNLDQYTYNYVHMVNNFIIDANRAVFNVATENQEKTISATSYSVSLDGNISGDGSVVKKGNGILNLYYESLAPVPAGTPAVKSADATGLTGANNNGIAWIIEDGILVACKQDGLGTNGIYINKGATLALKAVNADPLNPAFGKEEYENKIISSGGSISLSDHAKITLSGNIETTGNEQLKFIMRNNSQLELKGDNSKSNLYIQYGDADGGFGNSIYAEKVENLGNNLTVYNSSSDEFKDDAVFKVVLDYDGSEAAEYKGSLSGDIVFNKKGSGTVTLSGVNNYTGNTVISAGKLNFTDTSSIGKGAIIFDSINISSADYATVGIKSKNAKEVLLSNNVAIQSGAIFEVDKDQTLVLTKGVSAGHGSKYQEFIKEGEGEVKIQKADNTKDITVSSFTIKAGNFILDNGVMADSYFKLEEFSSLVMNENAGVKSNKAIDISSGTLTIFNADNIASAKVKFNNETDDAAKFSKLHITSNTVLAMATSPSEPGLNNEIEIKNGIDFDIDKNVRVRADTDVFKFEAADNKKIRKSGEGDFIFDTNDAASSEIKVRDLIVTGGVFDFKNSKINAEGTNISTMSVSGSIDINGGMLSISSGTHFTTETPAATTIKIGDASGIGIYDEKSIDSAITLEFNGTSEDKLATLLVQKDNVLFSNKINVTGKGLIIENEKALSFNGGIEGLSDSSIFAKSGAGKMTINTADAFTMGELRVLKGAMDIGSAVNISTLSVSGASDVNLLNNMTASKYVVIKDSGTKFTFGNASESYKLNTGNILVSDNVLFDLKQNTEINADVFDVFGSTITFRNSKINADINLTKSYLAGKGDVKNLTLKDGAHLVIGDFGSSSAGDKITANSVNFEKGSALDIDVNFSAATNAKTDVLDVSDNINVNSGVVLNINGINAGSASEDNIYSFEFIKYGTISHEKAIYDMFDINMMNMAAGYTANIFRSDNNSLMLEILKGYHNQFDPSAVATSNQKSIVLFLNDIFNDSETKALYNSLLENFSTNYYSYKNFSDTSNFEVLCMELSGVTYANSLLASSLLSKTDMVYSRLSEYTERVNPYKVWAQVYTNSLSVKENNKYSNPEFSNGIYGLIAGFDQQLDEYTVVGISGFYGSGTFEQLSDKADVTDAGIDIYGSYMYNDFMFKGSFEYATQNYAMARELKYLDTCKMESDYSVTSVAFDAQAEYNYGLGKNKEYLLNPFAGLHFNIVSNNDIEEKGDKDTRLTVKADSYTKADFRLGLGICTNKGERFNWHASVMLKQILTGDSFKINSMLSNVDKFNMQIESTKLSSTAFAGNIGAQYDISRAVNIFADLSADTSSNANTFCGSIGASYKW